jgi:CRP-like cAMP-binding protein
MNTIAMTDRSPPSTDDLSFLSTITLFRDIPNHDLRFLARLLRHQQYAAGEVIFEKDALTSDLVIIQDGTVSVYIPSAGQTLELARLGRGSYFGEMAIFDDYARSASTVAVTDVRVCLIGKDAFRSFLRFHPATLFQMCKVFSHRIRNTNSMLAKR